MTTTLFLTLVLSTGQMDGGYYVSGGTYWSQPYTVSYGSGWWPGYQTGWRPWRPFGGRYYTNYSYPTYSYPTYSYPTSTYVGTSGPCDVPVVQGSSDADQERTAARPDLGAEHMVRMTDRGGFEPAQIKINVGDTVTWRNDSGKTHSVTADPDKAADPAHVVLPKGAEKFDSGEIAAGKTFSQSFSTPGIYHYICRPHEHKGMVGTVIVTDPNAAESGHEHSGSEPPPPAPEGGSSY